MSVDPQGPKVGADEWVARQAHRREDLPSRLGDAQRAAERIGWGGRAALPRGGRPARLRDLGYVAFFGFGAYGYAPLSPSQLGANGIHLQYWLSLPIVMIGAALLGLAVGLPSRRPLGHSLPIVTL